MWYRSSGQVSVIGGNRMSIDLWEQTKQGYTDDYIAFVDEAIADLSSEQ